MEAYTYPPWPVACCLLIFARAVKSRWIRLGIMEYKNEGKVMPVVDSDLNDDDF